MDPGPDAVLLATAAAAALTGLSSSFHCFLMCGPLACAAAASAGDRSGRAMMAWQVSRVAAYALVGGTLGALGSGVGRALTVHLAPLAPWLLVITLLATALDPGLFARVAGPPRQLARIGAQGANQLRGAPRAALLGAFTALLPCGVLWGVFAASAATGSFGGGALTLGAFSLGAIPALAAAQLPAPALARMGASRTRFVLQRIVPGAAAVLLAARTIFAQLSPAAACH